jgi:O-antigen/teichoic acid export membrane protein
MIKKIKSFLFENLSARQTFTKNVFWLSVANVANRSIRAILIIYAARALGVAGYGIFSYAVGLAAFFSIFSDMGVSAMITKEASRDHSSIKKYLSAALFIKVILIAISAVLIIFIAPFFSNIKEALPLLPLAALLIAFDGLRDLTFAITRARERMELEAAIGAVTNIAITALGLITLLSNPTPTYFLLGYSLGSGLGTIFAWWMLGEYLKGVVGNFDLSLAKKVFVNAIPFSLMGLMGTLMLNTDTVILGYLSDAEQIGLYSAGQKIVFLLYMLPTILSSAIFPSMSRLAKENKQRFDDVLSSALTATFLISIPLFAGGVILSEGLMNMIYGNAFAAGISTFCVMLFTVILIFPQTFLTNGIFAFDGQKNFIKLTTIGVIGNAILDVILIKQYGIIGSAIATSAVGLIITMLMWKEMKKFSNFSSLNKLGKILIATGAMSALSLLLKSFGVHTLLNISASALFYFVLLFISKEEILEEFVLPIRKVLKIGQ